MMQILISNDDGIYAPGIEALKNAMQDLGEVCVAAPLSQQSAVGNAITLSDPIRVEEVYKQGEFFGYGVAGTPADSVKIALTSLLDISPDLIVSGINHGPNAGISILYSGTVSAATEGALLGIPCIAISIATFGKAHWDTAAEVAREVSGRLIKSPLSPGVLLNVNVPNVKPEEIKGYRTTSMAASCFNDVFHKRTDPRGQTYYWMDGDLSALEDGPDKDINAINDGYVSLTPVSFDVTHWEAMEQVEKNFVS